MEVYEEVQVASANLIAIYSDWYSNADSAWLRYCGMPGPNIYKFNGRATGLLTFVAYGKMRYYQYLLTCLLYI